MSEVINILYIIIAALFVLFAPGFFLSLLFFDFKKIDLIERATLSIALSISVVPLLTFYVNLLGIRISRELVILEVFIICSLCMLAYVIRVYLRQNK